MPLINLMTGNFMSSNFIESFQLINSLDIAPTVSSFSIERVVSVQLFDELNGVTSCESDQGK